MKHRWQERRVFVTGATGMVGSWLVKQLLEEGAFVVTLIHDWDPQSELIRSGSVSQTSVICGALQDYLTLERAINEHEIDTVFHLGAQTLVGTAFRSPLQTFETNIRGTYNLLEACRVHSSLIKAVVVASSDKAYGDAEELPYTEDMAVNGRHPYDVSKSCTDLIAMTYAHTYKLPVSVARCGNIYGSADLNWSRIVPGTIRSILENQRPVVRSDGHYTRDYIFVLDVVAAYLLLALETSSDGIWGEAFNFSQGKKVSVLEIVQIIQTLMARTDLDPKILDQADCEIRDQHLDSTKARTRLDWSPMYSLEQGLTETIHWYKSFLQQ